MTTVDVAFDDLDSRRAVLVESDRAVLSRIMQIVTLALRDFYACIVFSRIV